MRLKEPIRFEERTMFSSALLSSLISPRFKPKSILAIKIITAMTKTEKYFNVTTAADSDCLSSSSFNSLVEFNPLDS